MHCELVKKVAGNSPAGGKLQSTQILERQEGRHQHERLAAADDCARQAALGVNRWGWRPSSPTKFEACSGSRVTALQKLQGLSGPIAAAQESHWIDAEANDKDAASLDIMAEAKETCRQDLRPLILLFVVPDPH